FAADGVEPCLQALAATDRSARFLIVLGPGERAGWLVRTLGARRGLGLVDADGNGVEWGEVRARASQALGRGEVVGLPLTGGAAAAESGGLLDELAGAGAPVVPAAPLPPRGRSVFLSLGAPLPPGAGAEEARAEARRLADGLETTTAGPREAARSAGHV